MAAEPKAAAQEFTFSLKNPSAVNSRKTNFLGKFSHGAVDFTKWEQPVRMWSEKVKEADIQTPNMALPKAKRRKQIERYIDKTKERKGKKEEKTWLISDGRGEQTLQGKLQGQNASYTREGGAQEFKVYPIEEWYNFKSKKEYRKLTLEEAEAQLQSRNNKVNRWMMDKYKKEEKVEDIPDEEDKAQASGFDEDEDEFTALGIDEEEKKKKRKKKPKKEKGLEEDEEEGAEDEEEGKDKEEGDEGEPDYEGRASDDEEEGLPDGEEDEDEEDPTKYKDGESSEDDESKHLTDAGKDIKSLLRKLEREDREEESSDEEEEEKFDVNRLDMYKGETPKVKEEPGLASGEKRALSDDASSPPLKKAKTEGQVDEEELRKALLVLGKVKTKSLISRFKSQLRDQPAKARFAQLLRKLARVIDERGEKYLIIKDEYKYKNV